MSNVQDYTVGWLAPTRTDFVAAQQCLDEVHEVPETIPEYDHNVYATGNLAGHRVVMATFRENHDHYGPAIITTDMVRSFPNIRIVLSVSISGGAPTKAHDVRLGDVVVGSSVIKYDYGKPTNGHVPFQTLSRPPPFVQSAVSDLRAQHEINGFGIQEQVDQLLATHPRFRKRFSRPPAERDRLFRPESDHVSICGQDCQVGSEYLIVRQKRGSDDNEPAIHYGSIATGNQTVRRARDRDELASNLGVLCFTKNATGPVGDLPCVVICGICDYADSHRNNEWLGYAAIAAAVYAKNLLGRIDPIHLEAEGLAMPLSTDMYADDALDDAYLSSSSSDASSVFSHESSVSSVVEYESFQLPEQFATTLLRDKNLCSLYQKALSILGTIGFSQKHDILLKRLFADLGNRNNTGLQRQTAKLLRRPTQRGKISEWVIKSTITTLPQVEELEQKAAAGERLVIKHFPQLLGIQSARREENNSEASEDEDLDLDSESESYRQPPPSILGTLIEGPSFEAFKARVLCLSKPDLSIEDTLATQDVNLLTALLEQRFFEVATGEYAWISDLRAAGLRRREIAEILHSSEHDAPWIFFEPSPNLSENWKSFDKDFHHQGCSHSIVPPSTKRDLFSGVRSDMRNVTIQPQAHFQISDVQRSVQELCGLGGIVPDSRDLASWNGRVQFAEHGVVTTSYLMADPRHPELDTPAQIALRLHKISMRVMAALAVLQKSQLCCTSFTFLGLTEKQGGDRQLARLHNIPDLWVTVFEQRCRAAAEALMILNHEEETPECLSLRLWSLQILSQLHLENIVSPKDSSTVSQNNRSHLHQASVVLQLLCVGLLSYAQAHIGSFRPFFLDREVDELVLLGLDAGYQPHHQSIKARLVNLSCLAEMTGDKVMIFGLSGPLSQLHHTSRLDVRGTPEDILDTWGPGQVICRQDFENTPVAMILSGGFIFPILSDDSHIVYHWAHSLDIQPESPAMVMNEAIIVGAQVEVNQHCCNRTQESSHWKKYEGCMMDLGTGNNYWQLMEVQLGLQGGFHVVGLANATMSKIPGTSIKKAKLQQTADDKDLIDFLGCLWGVRVSYCTGVAQRVLLQHLAGDLLPIFAEAETNDDSVKKWTELRDGYHAFEQLQDVAGTEHFRSWLKTLPPHLHAFLLREIRLLLCKLASTGLSPDKRSFSVAWLSPQSLGTCIRIHLRDDHAKWLPILEDSGECATFAYMSSICLESSGLQCQGSGWQLNRRIPMLETSVHCPEQHGQWNLNNGQSYFFRNLDRELFWVKAEKDPRRLHENLPAILTALERLNNVPSRVANRLFERVRERNGRICERKRALTQSSEAAVVLSRRYGQ